MFIAVLFISLKLETMQIPNTRRMNKQTEVYSYNEILLNN